MKIPDNVETKDITVAVKIIPYNVFKKQIKKLLKKGKKPNSFEICVTDGSSFGDSDDKTFGFFKSRSIAAQFCNMMAEFMESTGIPLTMENINKTSVSDVRDMTHEGALNDTEDDK